MKGVKPAKFPANKAVTKRDWERSLRPHREYPNPVRAGSRFVQCLKDHPGATYDDIADRFGVTKARVCQMVALCKRLPSEITDFLMNTDEPAVLKHFTERRLRPLTLLASDSEKLHRFNEMKAEYRQRSSPNLEGLS